MYTKLRFIKAHRDYLLGEIATFSNNEAHALVDGGVARIYDPNEVYQPKKTTTHKYAHKMVVNKRKKI